MPNDTQHQLAAELPENDYRALIDYAEQEGLSLDEAVLRLAAESLAMRQLGRRLGVQNFERAPR
ncbi:hypothetical protein [Acidovorax sp. FG27]|uniref:hypothetical protein n=1 Tax=Acidovorax sp. FG27 TaxID=3133652 RepID=UPI0030E8A789